jgi:uncharacterized membrane protein
MPSDLIEGIAALIFIIIAVIVMWFIGRQSPKKNIEYSNEELERRVSMLDEYSSFAVMFLAGGVIATLVFNSSADVLMNITLLSAIFISRIGFTTVSLKNRIIKNMKQEMGVSSAK